MLLEQRQEQHLSLVMRLWQTLLAAIDWLLSKIRREYQAMESFLVSGIAIWMVVFFLNTRIFALSPVMYKPMADIGSPQRWGWRAFFLVVLWMYGALTKVPIARYASQVGVIGWYFFLGGMFASVGVVSWGAGIHLLGFVYALWVLWRYAGRKQDVP